MRTSLVACALLLVAANAQPATASADDSRTTTLIAEQRTLYASAVESFRQHRYAAAYGRFVRLADAGHVQSAQLALVMYRNGSTLFGFNWDATPEQLERWVALVVKSESGQMDLAPTK